jgi:hypothetical protein
MRSSARLGLVALVVCAGLLSATMRFAAPSAASSAAASLGPLPTVAQLRADIKRSVAVTTGPNAAKTVPPLLSAATAPPQLSNSSPGACYPNTNTATTVPTDFATSCVWGDITAHKSLFLFGDSQAWMWLPALDAFGRNYDWKIYFLAMPSCSPWITPFDVDYGGSSTVGCNKYRLAEISAANSVHPNYIIPEGMLLDYGLGHYATTPEFVGELKAMARALHPSGAKLLFLDPIPQFNASVTSATPAICLTAHLSSIQQCLMSPTQLISSELLGGITQFAKKAHAEVADTTQLFCTANHCALFINANSRTYLVYDDPYHMNLWYSEWISRAFGQILQPLLL